MLAGLLVAPLESCDHNSQFLSSCGSCLTLTQHLIHLSNGVEYSSCTSAGVRKVVSWCRKEILDPLAFGGEARVQQILKSSRRNINCFQEIAEKMAARGHLRTAEEY